MDIIINGLLSKIKQGSSFSYVAENRSFTDSESYSLSITFPLKNCIENSKIFGSLNRQDIILNQVKFDAEIQDKDLHLYGVFAVTDISESEVKGQFLSGKSVQNYDTDLSDIFINELDLGAPNIKQPTGYITLADDIWATVDYTEAVALPWVNNASGNMQNSVTRYSDGYYKFDSVGISFQPYLIKIAEKICNAIGYTYDFTEWNNSTFRHLIICNVLPYAWQQPEYSKILPNWDVEKFFMQLEKLMVGEFSIDNRLKHISYKSTKTVEANISNVIIDKVIDSFSVNVSNEDDSNYKGLSNLIYSDCSNNMWKMLSCDWFMKNVIKSDNIINHNTYQDMYNALIGYKEYRGGSSVRDDNYNFVHYCKDLNEYFILWTWNKKQTGTAGSVNPTPIYTQYQHLSPCNIFGGLIINDKDDAPSETLEICPAWIDYTGDEKGSCLYVDAPSESGTADIPSKEEIVQPWSRELIDNGEKSGSTEYFSRISVAYWQGYTGRLGNYLPVPITDTVMLYDGWTKFQTDLSLRINTRTFAKSLDTKVKYEFSFISRTIPNPRAIFVINNQRYRCAKLTCTFSEVGKSELIKGEFYRMII